MIRISLLAVYIAGLAAYAFKDWYKSLCGLIVLMAFIEHPDMPKTLFGIQGLNPWNLLLLAVLAGWAASRRREGLRWDMPRHLVFLLLLYLTVVLVGFFRMLADRESLGPEASSITEIWSEYFLNTLKWPVPGLLLFTGCRTRKRQELALWGIIGLNFLMAVQVIKWMPAEFATAGNELSMRALKIIHNEIGYSRVTVSMMLAGGSWATLAIMPLMRRLWQGILVFCAFVAVSYAQALTGGRMGYVTWGVVGLLLGLVRWRKYLLLAPAVVLLIMQVVPGATERMFQGFADDNDFEETTVNEYEVTSGRNLAWPYVIDKIKESPLVGYGQQAMVRTGISAALGEEAFAHPHNAYLELLLDNGWIGFLLVMPFYLAVLVHAGRLFLSSRDPMFVAAGGVTLALLLTLMLAALGSHSFYPRSWSVGLWAAIGLAFRLTRERARSRRLGTQSGRLPRSAAQPAALQTALGRRIASGPR